MDANWRWLHTTSGYTNCYTGNEWNTTLCPDGKTCAANCALDGADYAATYGVTASGNALTLKFVTDGSYSKNIVSRMYLIASDTKYQVFKLVNQEFTFDVDVSKLPCGLNGALYLIEIDEDSGIAQIPCQQGGCQVRHQILRYPVPARHQVHQRRSQRRRLDALLQRRQRRHRHLRLLLQRNGHLGSQLHLGRLHAARVLRRRADARYDGLCDKDGCDFNSYRLGHEMFYGPGGTVDTASKFTVVTQFIGSPLAEIKRFYVQGGTVIPNSVVRATGVDAVNSITDGFCNQQKTAFGDTNSFKKLGGLAAMGGALSRGMVLALSMWDDHAVNMLWLDSSYPTDKDASAPGVARGTCATSSGVPSEIEASEGDSQVVYSNIKWGAMNSTFAAS
ncbi:glycoside hydrolase [Mytilinidion resinicola]|uniref:Glucanase n=1 Tax=Mytilinidion resinicola TaxID=574789 RepID=A0A6A6YMZ5_9PEZI|nr:glycoside hydrolase [Mytilinidion resinicola]KAF2809929.1 glycoside hydrolase [Mytilinidion resinicola]